MLDKSAGEFPFNPDDVVLAKCDKEVYYAKVLTVHLKEEKAVLLFDDDSQDEIAFDNIFSGKYDVICYYFLTFDLLKYVHVCMHVCMYVCMYVCY